MDVFVLNPQVLDIANGYRAQFFASTNDGSLKSRRHAGYRQYVLWRFGRIGAGNRVVIPSCVVWRIRDTFPSSLGQYTGFRLSPVACKF